MAERTAAFLEHQPMVARALARQYPVIICDEHQDSSAHQHATVLAIHRCGSLLRIFGDPLQKIYGEKSNRAVQSIANAGRVKTKRRLGENSNARIDGKTRTANLAIGFSSARGSLQRGEPIDLGRDSQPHFSCSLVGTLDLRRTDYRLAPEQRRPIDKLVNASSQLLILGSQTNLVAALRGFWGRRIPIWEGHTREALAALVTRLRESRAIPK